MTSRKKINSAFLQANFLITFYEKITVKRGMRVLPHHNVVIWTDIADTAVKLKRSFWATQM